MSEKIILECDLTDLVMLYVSLSSNRSILYDSISNLDDEKTDSHVLILNRYKDLLDKLGNLLFYQILFF